MKVVNKRSSPVFGMYDAHITNKASALNQNNDINFDNLNEEDKIKY